MVQLEPHDVPIFSLFCVRRSLWSLTDMVYVVDEWEERR
jgi:hypothetical protein